MTPYLNFWVPSTHAQGRDAHNQLAHLWSEVVETVNQIFLFTFWHDTSIYICYVWTLLETHYFRAAGSLVSIHVVWETICDAVPSLDCENFVLILARIPYSTQARPTLQWKISVLGWAEYPLPLTQKMNIWSGPRTLSFSFSLSRIPPCSPLTYVEGAGVWRLIAVSPPPTVTI